MKSILERIADFFDLFDLSFLVSGATALGALVFLGWRIGAELPEMHRDWIYIVSGIIASYVLGLVCFAIGRWARMGGRWRRAEESFYKWFLFVLSGHGLTMKAPVAAYLERKESRGDWRLYVRMWADLRQTPSLAPSFSLLRRYWVMAATYDGLAVSLTLWATIAAVCGFNILSIKPVPKWIAFPSAVGLLISAVACSREASRYVEYQVEELVASIAAKDEH